MRVRSVNLRSVAGVGGCGLVRYPTLVDRKFVRFRNDERAFDHVLQFADVTRPGILLQRFESLFLNIA